MAKDITAIMAFTTTNDYNQLDQKQQVKLIAKLTNLYDGATLTEHMGGYMMADGDFAIEYSYTIELFGLSTNQYNSAIRTLKDLGQMNGQESIIINGDFIYLNKDIKTLDDVFEDPMFETLTKDI